MVNCQICLHPERAQIDSALVRPDTTLKAIAQAWGLEERHLSLHRKRHLLPQVQKRMQEQIRIAGDAAIQEISEIRARLRAEIDACTSVSDLCRLAAILHKYLETQLRLSEAPGYREARVNVNAPNASFFIPLVPPESLPPPSE